jgi:hypothetical protein
MVGYLDKRYGDDNWTIKENKRIHLRNVLAGDLASNLMYDNKPYRTLPRPQIFISLTIAHFINGYDN